MKLITTQVEQTSVVVAPQETHRIIVVDCSGSMYSELPKLRTHLKNKLPTMVLPGDKVSIIWFSGKNECGVLFEAIALDTLQDLSKVNGAIDRYLTAQGLTGFKQPLEETLGLVQRSSGMASSLHFMTDGYDNQWSKSEIMKACTALSDNLASATFVEYGFYANHNLLMEMAEEVGGQVILAENFTNYSENLETSLKSTVSTKKIKAHKIKADFVVGNLPDGFIVTRPDAVGTVTLPANVTSYSYLQGTGDFEDITETQEAAYMVAALIQRGQVDLSLQLAGAIGDEVLYHQVENSFSKQDFGLSVELATGFGSGKLSLFKDFPRNTNLVPDENAYNVLTLLMDLASQEGNYLDISHPDFQYNAIGGKRETAETTDGFKPVFKDKADSIKAEITALKFDEDRPNISILVKRPGTVTLPPNDLGFGDTIESFIWRNYAIVRDGIVNVRKLPVVLSKASHDLISSLGVVTSKFKIGQTVVIDTKKLPIINRSMAAPMTAKELFTDAFELYKLRAQQKFLGTKVEKPEFGAGFAAKYGEEGAKFLKELGIGEGGFSPKTVKGEAVDSYIAKVLEIKLAGLSSIPKIEDVEAAVAKGKALTPSQKVMSDVFNKYANITDYASELKEVKTLVRQQLNKIVMKKFGIILGKKIPTDLKSWEENTLELDFGLGKMIKCTAALEDKEI